MKIKVPCPNCGFDTSVVIEVRPSYAQSKEIVTCDLEEGGCDKDFLIKPIINVQVERFKISEAI